MKPRRLHSETIFSIKGVSFGSAIGRAVFLKGRVLSREPQKGLCFSSLCVILGASFSAKANTPQQTAVHNSKEDDDLVLRASRTTARAGQRPRICRVGPGRYRFGRHPGLVRGDARLAALRRGPSGPARRTVGGTFCGGGHSLFAVRPHFHRGRSGPGRRSMALDLDGRRFGGEAQLPKLREGEAEPYPIRFAQERDLPFIEKLYHQTKARSMVA